MAPPVAALYGPRNAAKLTLARAQWLRAIGQVADFWKLTVPYSGAAVVAPAADKAAKAKPGAAALSLPTEGMCLERAATILQVDLPLHKWKIILGEQVAPMSCPSCALKLVSGTDFKQTMCEAFRGCSWPWCKSTVQCD